MAQEIPTLSRFASELRSRNVLKPNQYYVEILLPSLLQGEMKTESELASMWCSNAHTPNSTLMTDDNYLEQGTRRKYAYDHDWQNLVLTFYIDQDFMVKKLFDSWKNIIVPNRRKFNYPADYTANSLNLYLLNLENQPTYLYEFRNIFPKDIQSVELNYSSALAPATCTVEFVYETAYSTSLVDGKVIDFSTKPNNFTENYVKIEKNAEVKDYETYIKSLTI